MKRTQQNLSALEKMNFFVERVGKTDLAAFERFMNRKGGKKPREGDLLP